METKQKQSSSSIIEQYVFNPKQSINTHEEFNGLVDHVDELENGCLKIE